MKRILLYGFMASMGVMANATETVSENNEAMPVAEPETAAESVETPKMTAWQQVLSRMPKVSGFLQTGYDYNSYGKGSSTFEAKRLEVALSGTLAPKATYFAQVEAYSGIAGTTNNHDQTNIQVIDAYVDYRFCPQFGVRLGQFCTPFGIENYYIGPSHLETIDYSNLCYRLSDRNPLTYNYIDYGRELGIMFMGELLPSNKGFNYLSYNLAITNGTVPCKVDNNKSKDIIAQIAVQPVKHLKINAGYQWSQSKTLWGEQEKALPFYVNFNRAIFGFWYNDPEGLDLRAEYGFGTAKKHGDEYVKEHGAYVLAGYRFGKWQPLLRWDMYRDDQDKVNPLTNYNRILAGCNWQVFKQIRIQLNYQLSIYGGLAKETNHDEGTSSQLQVMALVTF